MAEPAAKKPRTGSDSLVPIIDISALFGKDAQAKLKTAKDIGHACSDIGFFVVVNHGVDAAAIDGMMKSSGEFFDMPTEEKTKWITEDEAKYPYGYSKIGGEILSAGKDAEHGKKKAGVGDMKEMFTLGPKDPKSGMPPRIIPTNPASFDKAWDTYYEAIHALAETLVRSFALALNLPEDWFDQKMDRHVSALRSLNYPDQTGIEVPAGAIRASAHTDYGTVTVLRSGGPGLQVAKDKAHPAWIDVPHVPGGFIINLGDLMRRWTNDQWSSTLHRVINPPSEKAAAWGRRQSFAFFHNINMDAVVEAIPSCVSETTPALYDPIVAGEFLMLKHLASMGKAATDAHLKNARIPRCERAHECQDAT